MLARSPLAKVVVTGTYAAGALTGVIVERIAYRPVRGAPEVTLLLTSLAVTYILENLGILIFTSSAKNFPVPEWMDNAIQLFDGQITFTQIPEVIKAVLDETANTRPESINKVLECDAHARQVARQVVERKGKAVTKVLSH